jgi:hypothetical protein
LSKTTGGTGPFVVVEAEQPSANRMIEIAEYFMAALRR